MLNKNNIELLANGLNIELDDTKIKLYNDWYDLFTNYNTHTNLMSRGDIEVIFEKHVFDSLAVNLWKGFCDKKSILDVGTGGGFPSVILAICFPDKKIIANDSRIKKINFINEAKNNLKLDNLEISYSRIEDASCFEADLIVSRAVGKILDIYNLSKKHLLKSGHFLIYKSKSANEEIQTFKTKYPHSEFEIINYSLPLKENYERNLVILSDIK